MPAEKAFLHLDERTYRALVSRDDFFPEADGKAAGAFPEPKELPAVLGHSRQVFEKQMGHGEPEASWMPSPTRFTRCIGDAQNTWEP